jgi:hypothetical protein
MGDDWYLGKWMTFDGVWTIFPAGFGGIDISGR